MGTELSQSKNGAAFEAGTIGVGIATATVLVGYAVIVKDVNEELIVRARRELIKDS